MTALTAAIHTTKIDGGDKGSFEVRHRGTPADRGVLEQIFENKAYSISRLRRQLELRALYDAMPKPLIVDAGANIGASALVFHLDFPRAHVLAIEPHPENFLFLQTNLAGHNIDARQTVVGARDGRARLFDPGGGEWAYRAKADAEGDFDQLSMSRLIREKQAAGYSPFIVKVDIEGSESDLFSESTEWVDDVPILIVELHDWLMPKQGLSRSFLQCIAHRDRDFVCFEENVFSIRNG